MLNLNVTPSVAWGADKKVEITLQDTSLEASATPSVSVQEQGADPANKVDVTLAYDIVTGYFIGEVYLTSDSGSAMSPKLVLSQDATVQVVYGGATPLAITSIAYTVEQPKEVGKYVEVRSSVRNLHWDIVTLLCKAGWKFVETLPPKVNAQGYVTEFTHILKTVTTPRVDDEGNGASAEMFLIIQHNDYPGDNAGNFKELLFKLTPNYYYYDSVAMGGAPNTAYNDVLHESGGIYKLAEFPTYPLRLSYTPSSVAGNIPNVLDIPVNIWGYASTDMFSLIFQGEPSLVSDGFGQVSHIYCGQVQSFKEGKLDVGGNFALTGSSASPVHGTRYGTYTSDGVNTLSMYRTYGGLLWQQHYASIINDDPSGESKKSELYQPSSWTGKFHLSPIYVFHPTDGKRGFLKDTLAVSKQGILHLDELEIVKPVDECVPCPVDTESKPIDPNDIDHPEYANAWKREKYKYYRLTSGLHFLDSFDTGGKYTGVGLAIKMETEPANIIKFNTSYDIVTGKGVASWTGIGAVPFGAELAGARTDSISAGLISLNEGGESQAPVTLTGAFNPLTYLSESGAIRAEFLSDTDPVAATIAKATAAADGNLINFDLFRAVDLDANGKYGFRGTFYVDADPGSTSDQDDILEAQTADEVTVTHNAQTVSITL